MDAPARSLRPRTGGLYRLWGRLSAHPPAGPAAGEEELPLCPVCAFDGDVVVTGAHATAYLTYQIDQLAATDLATPAGWAGRRRCWRARQRRPRRLTARDVARVRHVTHPVRASYGRILLAMRDSPAGCATLGVNLRWTRVRLSALGGHRRLRRRALRRIAGNTSAVDTCRTARPRVRRPCRSR
jgi:hypothetical protein